MRIRLWLFARSLKRVSSGVERFTFLLTPDYKKVKSVLETVIFKLLVNLKKETQPRLDPHCVTAPTPGSTTVLKIIVQLVALKLRPLGQLIGSMDFRLIHVHLHCYVRAT
jgi:hypothetical protein